MSDEHACRIERIRDRAGRLGNSVAYNWPIRHVEIRDCLVELYYLLAEVERLEQRNRLEATVVAAALAERRAELDYMRMNGITYRVFRKAGSPEMERAYDLAVDALLAFNGEEAGDE